MKVVAFNGSSRTGGNTAAMIEHCFGPLRQSGVDCQMINLASHDLHYCKQCLKCREDKRAKCRQVDDAFNQFVDMMIEADGVILACPSYFAGVTPELKALIDRTGMVNIAGGFPMARKVAAAIVSGRRAGLVSTFSAINNLFLAMNMIVVGSSYWNIGYGLQRGDVQNDAEALATMADLGRNMAWALEKLAK